MFPFHFATGRLLVGSVILGLFGVYTLLFKDHNPVATQMKIFPLQATLSITDEVTLAVVVESNIAVNAFSGQVSYDPKILTVSKIEYNDSIANLWVEEPWYSAGEGKINFAGGTTKPGGFTGEGNLLEITFKPLIHGKATVKLSESHIFAHDGFGTESILPTPIDTLFTIEALETQANNLTKRDDVISAVEIVPERLSFDLNQDQIVSFIDVSIFMLHIFSKDAKYDFNTDGVVDLKDLSLLMAARN
jgi:hypothetical protein